MGGIEGNPTWAAEKRNCPSGQVVWVGSGQSKAIRRSEQAASRGRLPLEIAKTSAGGEWGLDST
jgi:hypothetical protein